MRKKKRMSPDQKAKLAHSGLGILDAALKALANGKRRRVPGRVGTLKRPSSCGRCD